MFGRKNTDDQNNYTTASTPQGGTQETGGVAIGGYVSPYSSTVQDTGQTAASQIINNTPGNTAPASTPSPATTPAAPSMEAVGAAPSSNANAGFNSPVVTTLAPSAQPLTTSIPNGNILDDPVKVSQILSGDGSGVYASPVTSAPSSETVNAQVTVEPTPQAATEVQTPAEASVETQSIESLLKSNIVPTPSPTAPSLPESLIPQTNVSPIVAETSAPAPTEVEQELHTVAQVTAPESKESEANLQQAKQTESQSTPAAMPESQPMVAELNPEVDLAGAVTSGDEIVIQKDTLHIKDYLDVVIEKNASDLHLTVGYPAQVRIDGKLQKVGPELNFDQVKGLIYETLGGNQKELLEVNKEVDLSYQHENKARFRVNAYNERGNLAAAYRLIPTKIRTIEELNLPPALYDFTRLPQGLFLVTGPTGHGKSTTLAAMLQEVNLNYPKHIVTIEDPIEYVYQKSKALVDQRELGQDTHDWSIALRSILRQDPDVVLIGEMRDFETIQAAITIAETGHLVFATLHTNSAAQSIDRIIDVFPPHQQEQIRTQLAGSLKGILSQRLIPTIGGGRRAAIELMIVNPAIQNLIREGKTYQIDNIISTSYDIGMVALERSLVRMVREGKITVETAQEYAIRPEEVLKLMKSGI